MPKTINKISSVDELLNLKHLYHLSSIIEMPNPNNSSRDDIESILVLL